MEDDIVRRLREQERILGEMSGNTWGLMDDLLREAFDPERFFQYAASLGYPQTGIPGKGKTGGHPGPYWFLQLERTASDDEVKKRYRGLLKVLHPDTAQAKGTGRLLELVNAAYQQIAKERGWQ
jgi:DnaJ-domain-containing protein 1